MILEAKWAELGPCVTGATGGSGTRVVARIARRAGLFIGTDLNQSDDALRFGAFSDRWINAYLSRASIFGHWQIRRSMQQDLRRTLEQHLQPVRGTPCRWGWKEPRSMYLLPFWNRHFPRLRFLHLVRDGRDMSYSANQNQLRKHGHMLLDPEESQGPEAVRSMALWQKINLQVAEYAEKHLPTRYLRLRFEDLCLDPVSTTSRILSFFGLEGEAGEIAGLEVASPVAESLGRWKRQDVREVAELDRIGRLALLKFGYLPLV